MYRRYCRKLGLDFATFAVLTPLPGTDLFDEVRDRLLTRNFDLYDFIHTLLPTSLPLEDFFADRTLSERDSSLQADRTAAPVSLAGHSISPGKVTPRLRPPAYGSQRLRRTAVVKYRTRRAAARCHSLGPRAARISSRPEAILTLQYLVHPFVSSQ
jgi:radical SAM superfamily enzyme YgiQ (UPF0313 family)